MEKGSGLKKRLVKGIYEKIWKPLGRNMDEKLAGEFRLLYMGPERDIRVMVENYRLRQIKMLLVCAAAAVLFFLLLLCKNQGEISEIRIFRNGYGEGSREESILLDNGESIAFEVEEVEYGSDEVNEAFFEAFVWIEEHVLKENISFREVRTDLDFMTEVPGGFQAEWQPEKGEYIGYDGQVMNEDWEEGRKEQVKVLLSLSYKEMVRTREYDFCIMPPAYTEREKLILKIKRAIEKKEKETRQETSFSLKEELKDVSLKKEEDRRGSGMGILFFSFFGLLFFYNSNRMKEKLKERKEQMEEDYPFLIHKLVLYLSAGMNLRHSFLQIMEEYLADREEGILERRYVYEELILMNHEMEAGMGEIYAYESFGARTGDAAYGKLVSLLVQNLQKGNEGLLSALREEESNANFLRIDRAKRAGEEAGTKLLFPMLLMMIVVIAIVMTPALFQFGSY